MDLDADFPPQYDADAATGLKRRSFFHIDPSAGARWPTGPLASASVDADFLEMREITPWIPPAESTDSLVPTLGRKDSSGGDFNAYTFLRSPGTSGHTEKLAPGPSTSPGLSAPNVSDSSTSPPVVANEIGGPRRSSPAAHLSPEVRSALPPLSDADLDRLAERVASMTVTSAPAPPPGAATPRPPQSPSPRQPHADEEAPPGYTRE